MPRSIVLLLCAVVTLAVSAAPAPVYKPESSKVWFTGWDEPLDPVGDCRFDRHGDRLTIRVPGDGHDLDIRKGNLDAPRLLRGVEGDFAMNIRVRGNFLGDCWRRRQAGLVILSGRNGATMALEGRIIIRGPACHQLSFNQFNVTEGHSSCLSSWPAMQSETLYIVMTRRGQKLWIKVSLDGKKWKDFDSRGDLNFELSKKVSVGVFAATSDKGKFEAVFDQFSLEPLK